VTITNNNFRGLFQLCEEFHFRELSEQLSEFRQSHNLPEEVVPHSVPEERMQQPDQEIAGVQADLSRLSQIWELAVERLLALEEQMQERDREIVSLRRELSWQSRVQELSEQRARAEADSASRQANELQKTLCAVRSDVKGLRTALRKVRELARKAKVVALVTQRVSEGIHKKAELREPLLRRVEWLETEFSSLRAAQADELSLPSPLMSRQTRR
jgi:chromosome segregation ATPase